MAPVKTEEVIERKEKQLESETKRKYFGLYKWDILKAKVCASTSLTVLICREKSSMASSCRLRRKRGE